MANFWRRQPRAALDGSLRPTRQELLDRYIPKVAPPLEVLSSINPRRAVEYWQGALQILVEDGFLAKEGEAALTSEAMIKRLGCQEWQKQWLKETVDLRPGPKMRDAVMACAGVLPVVKPRDFGQLKSQKKRPGRPSKKSETPDPS